MRQFINYHLAEVHVEKAIIDFVAGKRVAVVGVSRYAKKFGSSIYTELKGRGYQVFGVNPAVGEVSGDKCYPNLTALQGQVDGAVICIKPSSVEPVLREAAAIGLKNIWLQWGADTPENVKLGRELGLNLVSGKCILMYAEPVRSFHSFHRFFVKLFGKL
jgi:predicted CoA-binding protein